jgi:hypothetical protein
MLCRWLEELSSFDIQFKENESIIITVNNIPLPSYCKLHCYNAQLTRRLTKGIPLIVGPYYRLYREFNDICKFGHYVMSYLKFGSLLQALQLFYSDMTWWPKFVKLLICTYGNIFVQLEPTLKLLAIVGQGDKTEWCNFWRTTIEPLQGL